MTPRIRLANLVRLAVALIRQPESHAVKSVGGDYRSEWNDLITEQQRSKQDKAAIEALIVALIIIFARRAFLDGMKKGGVDEPEASINNGDRSIIATWAASQSLFADGMAQAIIDSRTPAVPEGETITQAKDEARQVLLDRAGMWAASLGVLKLQGMVRADDVTRTRTMGTWRYGDTMHCHSQMGRMGCAELNGMRMPLSWFRDRGYMPGEPGSETLACGGWHCQCGIYGDDGGRLL